MLPFSKLVAFLALAFLCVGCSRSAPDLPPDLRQKTAAEAAEILEIAESDLALSCPAILGEMDQLRKNHNVQEATIRSHRSQNQTAGYIGAFFFLAYLVTESDSDAKSQLDSIQRRFDQLYYLKSIKGCLSQ
ncbi:MAG: hypothetical protein ABJN40_17640 [Sneathiella sp.]